MGECGCTSGQERFTFEGPEDYRYVFVLNPGCSNCGYGPVAGISRYKTEPDEDGFCQNDHFEDLPEVEFGDDSWWDPTCLYILDLDIRAREKIKETLKGQEIWPPDMDEEKMVKIGEYYAEDLAADVVLPAVMDAVRDTIHESIKRLHEELREKDDTNPSN